MRKLIATVLACTAVLGLSACSSNTDVVGSQISFDHGNLVLHASGHADAQVGSDGSLSIDGKIVAVDPGQRELLQRYYRETVDAVATSRVLSEQGRKMGTHAVGDILASVLQGKSDDADKQMETESKKVVASANQLCADFKTMNDTRKAIVAQMPTFAPYATASDDMHCKVKDSTTINIDGNSPASATTSTQTID